MIQELELQNFRCFSSFKVTFGKLCVLVGRNNAGKSTITDALKLIANACRYAAYRRHSLEERDVPFPIINLRHNYNERKDTSVVARFDDGTEVEVIFPADREELPHVWISRKGKALKDRHVLLTELPKSIGIIPPVGSSEDVEKLGDEKYVRSVMVSHLTPRHFRNIWYYFRDGFDEFRTLVEKTCPGYTIQVPARQKGSAILEMFVNEDRIPREIAWLGHGFQVWLQLLTFLVKSGHKETLVLDEPDIFLHSDLQKRLVDVCRQLSSQTIVATHAVDIIEDVDPEDIVLVDKHINETVVLSTMNDVQKCINELGSYQNVRLAHLLRGRTCLFVEGKDFKLLRSLARKLDKPGFAGEDGFGVVQIEGFSNWERLKHVDWFSRNALGEPMKYYAILDRDYYPPNFVEDVERTLRSKGVVPHVWTRKELENYLVDYDALYRVFVRRLSARDTRDNATPTFKSFCASLDSIAHTLRDDVFGQIAAKRLAHPESRSRDQSTTASLTFAQFTRDWGDRRYRTQVIPGKEFFARVNRRLGDRYRVSISAGALIQSLRPQDVDTEIASVIDEFMNLVRS